MSESELAASRELEDSLRRHIKEVEENYIELVQRADGLEKKTAAALSWSGHCVYAPDNASIDAVRHAIDAEAIVPELKELASQQAELLAALDRENDRLKAIETAARVVDEEFDPDDPKERPVATALLDLRRTLHGEPNERSTTN